LSRIICKFHGILGFAEMVADLDAYIPSSAPTVGP
jgi:hypothetical protein